MRARYPDRSGFVDSDSAEIFYEIYDKDAPTVVLVPTWNIFHSRSWKMQIPYLSRHYRVITYDPRGNGKSGRPEGTEHHGWRHYIGDLVGVMDATETDQAVLVGLSFGGFWANVAAVLHPERVLGVVAIGPGSGLGIALPERSHYSYTDKLDTTEGWAKENVHFMRAHYRDYVEFFVAKIFTEPHSTKQIEDGIAWAMETDAEQLISSDLADVLPLDDTPGGEGPARSQAPENRRGGMWDFYRRYSRPLLIIHGSDDAIAALDSSYALAELTGGSLMVMDGCGHAPNMRDPVRVNLAIRDFVEEVTS